MTITYQQKYLNFLEDFISNNKVFLDEINKDKKVSYFKDLHLYETPELKKLVNDFYETFINLDGLTFDLNNHVERINGKTFKEVAENPKERFFSKPAMIEKFKTEVFKDILDIYNNKEHRFHLFYFGENNLMKFIEHYDCEYCNKSVYAQIDYINNKIVMVEHLRDNKCPKPEQNQKNIKVKLQVPSKKIVILNSLKEFIKEERPNKYEVSVNSTLGVIQETQFYENMNIGLLYVSNTSPNIYRGDREIIISNLNEENRLLKTYTKVGSICTDLWWYTVLDYNLFKKITKNKDIDDLEYEMIDIDNTECEITHTTKIFTHEDHRGILSSIKY